jgi:transcriptional regulator with XRE-family HTH domain
VLDDVRSPDGLKAWRAARGLSQRELGELLDVTNMSVWRWESGAVPIPRVVELALHYLTLTGAPAIV